MKPQFVGLGLSAIVMTASPALAVQPASVSANDNIAWSKVVENPFDGRVVYDRNYQDDYVLVSSWAKSGIRATFTQSRSVLLGYKQHHRHFWGEFGIFPNEEPVYQQSLIDSVPDSISLAINGKLYTYQNGSVSPDLAAALSGAPAEKIKIRLVWKDGRTKDTEIGKGTVQAWKTVFQP